MKYALLCLVTLRFAVITKGQAATCKPSGISCLSTSSYQLCVNGAPAGTAINCPPNTICNDDGAFPCVSTPPTTTTSSPTTTTTTTTVSPPVTVTPPNCQTVANSTTFPGPQCNQYYQCVFVMWWWDMKLITCPAQQAYDDTTKSCQPSAPLNCILP